MTISAQWTIDEMVTRYQLEPSLRDIFVEGASDFKVVKWYLGEKGIADFVIYEIGNVEVEIPDAVGLKKNFRLRAIKLAEELAKQLSRECKQLTFIIDADLDHFLNSLPVSPFLLVTDFVSLELYIYNEEILKKILRLTCGLEDNEITAAIESLTAVLQELFLIRVANKELDWHMTRVDIDKSLTIDRCKVSLNARGFIERYLNRNSKVKDINTFLETIESLRPKLTHDRRLQIHGHDFLEVLNLFLKSHIRTREAVPEAILLANIKVEHLDQSNLFQQLLSRIAQ